MFYKKLNRRNFFKYWLFGSALSLLPVESKSSQSNLLNPTPKEIKGPFYPVFAQKDKDFDLTRIEGRKKTAKGKIIYIEGKVIDTSGNSIEDATVDLWQANTYGRYNHPNESNSAPLDQNFQGWAIVPSGKDGGFKFKTIFPGSYPASRSWTRPPHIHFKVFKTGYVELVTQMYFPNQELNQKDLLLNRKSKIEQKQMISTLKSNNPETYSYNIILQKPEILL